MRQYFTFSSLILLFILLSIPFPLLAQEATETTEPPTEEVATTEAPVIEVTDVIVPSETAAPLEEQTVESTEVTAEATSEQTEVVIPVQPEITNTATEAVPLLPEPTLTPVLSEAFHTDDLSRWNIGTGWELVTQEQGFALQVTNSDAPVSSNVGMYDDVAVELLVQWETGTFHLHLRDAYTLTLYPTGQVDLYRGATLLMTTTVTPAVANQWRHVRFSAMSDTLRVAIDNVEIIALRDTEPTLAAGQIAFNATFPEPSSDAGQQNYTLLVDNIRFWIPESKLPAATHTVTLTPSVTFVPTMTPIPPLDVTNTAVPSATTEPTEAASPSATTESTEIVSPSATIEPTGTATPLTSVEESSAVAGELVIQQESGDEWCAEFNFTSTAVAEYVTARIIGGETRGRYVSNSGWQPCTNCFGDDMVSLDIRFAQVATVTSVEFQLSSTLPDTTAYGSLGQWDGVSHINSEGISNQQTDPLSNTETLASFTPAYTNANGINIGYDDVIGAGPALTIAIQRLRMAGTGQSAFPSAYDCPVIPPPQNNVIVVDDPGGGQLQGIQSTEGVGIESIDPDLINNGFCSINEGIYKANYLSSHATEAPDPQVEPFPDCAPIEKDEDENYPDNAFIVNVPGVLHQFTEPGQLDPITGVVVIRSLSEPAIIERWDEVPTPQDFRLFEVMENGDLTLENIIVRNGRAVDNGSLNSGNGGGILNAGNLTLINSAVIDNYAEGYGGGIYNVGTLTVQNISVQNNVALGLGGGIYNAGSIIADVNGVHISGGCLVGNTGLDGSDIYSTSIITAANNWWGTAQGPIGNAKNDLVSVPSHNSSPPPNCIQYNADATCQASITAAPAIGPYTSQEAQDMLAIVEPNGTALRIHVGPTMNAQVIGTLPRTTAGQPTTVTVHTRLQFPQFPDELALQPNAGQVWYEIELSLEIIHDLPANVAALNITKGWIMARLANFEPNPDYPTVPNSSPFIFGTPKEFLYLEDGDPCGNEVEEPSTVTFTYSRDAAGEFAITHSYINNADPIQTETELRATRRLTNGSLPFANFKYIDLGSGTASAMFTSQSIWMGHLPMLVSPDYSVGSGGRPAECQEGLGYEDAGWIICVRTDFVDNRAETSPTWDAHEGLLGYYTRLPSEIPAITGIRLPTNNILDGTTGQLLPFRGADRLRKSELERFLVFGGLTETNYPDVVVADASGLSDYVGEALGSTLTRGDYVLINTGLNNDPNHGLLVVGWGDIEDCSKAVIDRPVNLTLVDLSPSFVEMTVPYVADFTRAQQPVPRPFYCTNWNQGAAYLNFREHDWFFFTIPSYITITSDKLYVDPVWQWTSTDGLIVP